LDNYIPYKDTIICEMMRGAVLWVLWNERNKLIFEGGNIKSVRTLGGDIISLIKCWSQLKYKDKLDTIHFIIPLNVSSLRSLKEL
jgi:hypothetical protein